MKMGLVVEKDKMVSIKNVWDSMKTTFLKIIEPLGNFLVRLNINPNAFTTVGFSISMFSGYFLRRVPSDWEPFLFFFREYSIFWMGK